MSTKKSNSYSVYSDIKTCFLCDALLSVAEGEEIDGFWYCDECTEAVKEIEKREKEREKS